MVWMQFCSTTVGIAFLPVQKLAQHLILGCYLWVLTLESLIFCTLTKKMRKLNEAATQCLKETDGFSHMHLKQVRKGCFALV
ncbi:hypothetical protein P8452_48892 [Trifolium repens]|nr:hypothetical protein P8452_48892 [Trifolium repens]